MQLKFRLFAIAISLMATSVAQAIPIQYSFDSGPLTLSSSPPQSLASLSSVSGTFTVDLAPDLAIFGVNYPLLSYMFTDGNVTIDETNTDYTVANAFFYTSNTGAVTDYAITLSRTLVASTPGTYQHAFISTRFNSPATPLLTPSFAISSYVRSDTGGLSGSLQATSNTSLFGGPTAVPEPGTLALLAAGFGVFGFMRPRRTGRGVAGKK